jgi:hypothetical protein
MLIHALLLLRAASCQALPLTPGTSWTYRADVAWTAAPGDSMARRSISWTTRVIDVRATDSAVVATVDGWPTDLAWWTPERARSTSVLYCIGGRLYVLHPQPGTATSVVDELLNGRRRPSLDALVVRLPLRTGDLYGRDAAERQDNMYAWYVESATPAPDSLRRLASRTADSVYSLVYRTLPDFTRSDFLPGLGMVRYVYSHHGTTADSKATLVAFRPG